MVVSLILAWTVSTVMLVIKAIVNMEGILTLMTQSKVITNAMGKRVTSLAILRFITLVATQVPTSFMKISF